MKALTLRLSPVQYEKVRALSYVERRPISELIREALDAYIEHKARQAEFQVALNDAMDENAWLIAELAKH
jgi:predicted DNA-binding protein